MYFDPQVLSASSAKVQSGNKIIWPKSGIVFAFDQEKPKPTDEIVSPGCLTRDLNTPKHTHIRQLDAIDSLNRKGDDSARRQTIRQKRSSQNVCPVPADDLNLIVH